MEAKPLRFLFTFICLALSVTSYADDCDSGFVSRSITELESKPEYKNCKLEDMKDSYLNSSKEYIQILELLKDAYKQSLSSNSDSNSTKNLQFQQELDNALSTILTGNNIDPSADNGLTRLQRWTKDVHIDSKDPKKRLRNLRQTTLSTADRLTLCKAKFQWKKLKKWRNRILYCINQVRLNSDTSDSSNDNDTSDSSDDSDTD